MAFKCHYFYMLFAVTDYRGCCETLLPVQKINVREVHNHDTNYPTRSGIWTQASDSKHSATAYHTLWALLLSQCGRLHLDNGFCVKLRLWLWLRLWRVHRSRRDGSARTATDDHVCHLSRCAKESSSHHTTERIGKQIHFMCCSWRSCVVLVGISICQLYVSATRSVYAWVGTLVHLECMITTLFLMTTLIRLKSQNNH